MNITIDSAINGPTGDAIKNLSVDSRKSVLNRNITRETPIPPTKSCTIEAVHNIIVKIVF